MSNTSKTKNSKEVKKLSDLIADDKNFNTGTPFGNSLIEKSFRKFGAGRSILIDKNNRIIAGNKSVENAASIGMEDVQVIESDGKKIIAVKRTDIDLDSPEGREMALADNASAKANIVFDAELVEAELGEAVCTEWGIDTGKKLEAEEDDYEIPDTIETDIVLGDLFEIGEHRLLCGDSTDSDAVARLMDGKKADFCFTSPPYNAAMNCAQMHSKAPKAGVGGLYVGGYTDDRSSEDYIQFNTDIINTLSTVAADNFTLCYNINYNKNSPSEYIDVVAAAKDIIPLVETIVWEKQMAVSLQGDNLTRIYEFVFVLAKGKFKINKNRTECLKNLWKISNVGANHSSHKACFPVGLVAEGIKNFCVHGGAIIEPFGGSGTTMVAAHPLGCKAYLMELDPKYCQVIIDRMLALDPTLTIKKNGEPYAQTK